MTAEYNDYIDGVYKYTAQIILGCIRIELISEQRNGCLYKHFCTLSLFGIDVYRTFWRTGHCPGEEEDLDDFFPFDSYLVSETDKHHI